MNLARRGKRRSGFVGLRDHVPQSVAAKGRGGSSARRSGQPTGGDPPLSPSPALETLPHGSHRILRAHTKEREKVRRRGQPSRHGVRSFRPRSASPSVPLSAFGCLPSCRLCYAKKCFALAPTGFPLSSLGWVGAGPCTNHVFSVLRRRRREKKKKQKSFDGRQHFLTYTFPAGNLSLFFF